MPDARLTPEQLARYRADYHQCGATIVPLLDEIDALLAERDAAWDRILRLVKAVGDAEEALSLATSERASSRSEAARLAAKVEKHERKLSRVCRLRDYLRDENASLQRQIEGHCARIAAQAELLSKRAEKAAEGGG